MKAALALLAITVLLAAGIPKIEPEVDFVDTVPADPDLALYRDVLERLDGVRFVVVHMPYDASSGLGSLRTDAGFDGAVRESDALAAHIQGTFPAGTFTHALSPAESMRAANYMTIKVATAGRATDEDYRMPDDATRDAVRAQAIASSDDVLAADGSSALLLLFVAEQDGARAVAGRVVDIVAAWSSNGDHPATKDHQASGLLVAQHVVDEQNRQDMLFWGSASAAAVVLVLLWAVRRPANVAIAVASLLVAGVWLFGLMGWSGIRLSFLSVFLAPVVLGIGIDHAVHLLHRVEEEAQRLPRRAAIRAAIASTGRANALAAGTTALALLFLAFVPAPLFAEIGIVAAGGIVLALIASLTVTPVLRAWVPDGTPRPDALGPALARWADRVGRAPLLPLLTVLLVVAAAGFAATYTRIGVGEAENEFPADDPTVLLRHRIEAEYGAFERAYLIVEGPLTAEALRALHQATIDASTIPLARGATSVADLVLADEATDEGSIDIARAAIQGISGTRPSDADRLPQDDRGVQSAIDRLATDPLWRTILPFTLSSERDLAIVAITLQPWNDTSELTTLRDTLEAHEAVLQEALPDHRVAAGGSPVNRAAILEATVPSVLLAGPIAAGAVTLVLAAFWARHGWLGIRMAMTAGAVVLVAGLVLLGAVPALDAFYGWTGANQADLNLMFLLAFAVTVGVGVDDTVHIAQRRFESGSAAAFRHAGRAVTATTLTSAAAFAVLSGMYFLQSKNLAILATVGIATAFGLTMLLVPVTTRTPTRAK